MCLVLWAGGVAAQQGNRFQQRAKVQAIIPLKYVPIPGTVTIDGVASSNYAVQTYPPQIQFSLLPTVDSITIQFRFFPPKLFEPSSRYNYNLAQNQLVIKQVPRASNTSLFNFGNLQYNGSLGRNLSFGNRQDAVFNSQLNLQLNGYLADSVYLSAAITDNNIPIQPEGNTQQLNEFDRILLQFSKRQWKMSLGDIDVRQNTLAYMPFYKRLQGLGFSNKWGRKTEQSAEVVASIARGKFARNILPVIEGNQGPYRLQGNNGELFLIVLSNTEKVFVDGVQLQRGEDQDYVINYNTAEIVFTPKNLITKDKRVQVEFEYADRNYLNSFLFGKYELKHKGVAVQVGGYSNADAKSSPINQALDDSQRQFLASVGDSIQSAVFATQVLDTLAPNRILYKKMANPLGVGDSIFVYSTQPDSAIYRVSFVNVGSNRGNYIPLQNGANGQAFVWVPPAGGLPQGQFQPGQLLVTPKIQQGATVQAQYQVSKQTQISAAFSASRNDVNTFSSKQKENDVGTAIHVQLTHQTKAWGSQNNTLTWNAGAEIIGENFTTMERIRTVEFYRDWGMDLRLLTPMREQVLQAGISLKNKQVQNLQYNIARFTTSTQFSASRHTLAAAGVAAGFQYTLNTQYTQFTNQGAKGSFLKPTLQLSKVLNRLGGIQWFTQYSIERNVQFMANTDSVLANSFSFTTFQMGLKSNAKALNKWQLVYFTRADELPIAAKMQAADRSWNVQLQYELLKNLHRQWRVQANYRNLTVKIPNALAQQSDAAFVGRTEYTFKEWKGFVQGNVLYEVGRGQEQQRSLLFIQVPTGRGEYTWIDYNGDGIQQINEFEIAQFADQAKFVRFFTPTNRFVPTNYVQFNYNFQIVPRLLISPNATSIWAKYAKTLQFSSALQAQQKTLYNGVAEFNPFQKNIADSSLLQQGLVANNTLSINRFSSRWGVDVTYLIQQNKALLSFGTESRTQNEWNSKARVQINKQWTVDVAGRLGTQQLQTPSFENRNYRIVYSQYTPRLAYTLTTVFRAAVSLGVQNKQNTVGLVGETSTATIATIDAKYNAVNKTSISARFSSNSIVYKGDVNSPVSFFMLDGLAPGRNFLWNIDVTKRLINNLELSVQYEGRRPGNTNTIHLGRASIRALL